MGRARLSGTSDAVYRGTSGRDEIRRPCINVGTCHEIFFKSRHPCTPSRRLLVSLRLYLAPCLARIQDFASTFCLVS